MRTMVLIPVAIVATAAVGALVSMALGHFYMVSMVIAGGIALIAALGALVPVILARGGNQAVVSQAGLLATLIHLLLMAMGVAIVILSKIAGGVVFIAWVMGFYLATLVVVVTDVIVAIRRAPSAKAA